MPYSYSVMVHRLPMDPDIEIEIVASDKMVDIVGEGFDAGIRHGGTVPEDMIAQRLSRDLRWCVAGAPAYLDRYGTPENPRDLRDHLCLGFRLGDDRVYHWEFEGPEGDIAISVPNRISVSGGRAMLPLALAGAGLMYANDPEPCWTNG